MWVVVLTLLALLIVSWGWWASSFGDITLAARDAEIRELIKSTHEWETKNDELARLRKIMLANPLSIPDPIVILEKAEMEVQTATQKFEKAGFRALNGEMIIILGVILQLVVVLVLLQGGVKILAKVRTKNKKFIEIQNYRTYWVEQIRLGQVLLDEDEILKYVDDEIGSSQFPIVEIVRGQQTTDAYRRLMIKCRKATVAEIPWLKISSLLYKLTLIFKERGKVKWEQDLRNQYRQLRHIIQQDINDMAFSSIGIPFLFCLLFLIISIFWNSLSGAILKEQLDFWRNPILLIGAAFAANGIVHVWGGAFALWIVEKTWTDLDDVIISAILGPLSALATAIFLLSAIEILTGSNTPPLEFGPFLVWIGYEATANISRTLVVIFVTTWFAVFILNRVLVWFMEQWSKRTTQIYDDMFVKMVQVFGTFILLALGIGASLAVFNGPLSEATGVDNIILPYTIIVSVFTAIAGYAASAGFENFFGGLLLQIEKPFDRGERIILPDGQICDVRDVGMRSTVLYNVTEHSEVSVPNSEMAKMVIKNTSRPDLELRIAVPAWIAPGTHNLKNAGAVLLDIAYLEREVDQMRVFEDELTKEEQEKMKQNQLVRIYRYTIKQGLERLVNRHAKIRGTIVSQIEGGGKSNPVHVFNQVEDSQNKEPWEEVLESVRDARKNYSLCLTKENDWLLGCIQDVEGSNSRDVLRNYRRAINEITYSNTTSSSVSEISSTNENELTEFVREVALRERIDVGKLFITLVKLSGSKGAFDQKAIPDIKKQLRKFESERLGIVLQICDEMATLGNYIYAIGEQYPDVRPELDGIIGEMAKEPSVSSEYSDDGHVQLTLSCYALYLERRLEIQHKINRDIEWRFSSSNISFDRPSKK
jgi:small-conductance mechanosensitive channel